jgi:hypothetical protein
MVAAPAAVALERVSAHEVRIENIRTIGQVYNIFPQAESAPPIAASLRRRLDSLLAHHRPFGGREELLDALDALAADDATGYVFVTAGSGFGKTALLANWLLRSMATGGEPVYHFINRAEGVADEQFTLLNLCQQLVAAHGMSGQLPVLTAELRSLFSQLLMTPPPDESRLIIILDGLDEALGWTAGADMFPALANGIRVVFSARREADTHWLDRLRLAEEQVRVLELGPLSRADIARLLENAGARAAAHATNADTLESLHKASGGDPFYLRFLVEDLNRDSSGGIGAPGKSVAVQPPSGLRNYLEEWWNQLAVDVDIELEQAYDLLGLLTVAKGPLRVGELVGVLDTLRRGALLKRELGGKIRRYLVGSADDGYALCHTRFRAYLKEDVFDASEIDRYQTALLAFCERWRETGSAYALSYYPSHLIDLGQRDQLARLISREWLDARFTRDRSYRGFVADIELAAPVFFDLKTLDDFVQLCRLALVRATAVSLAASVPDDAIVALAASGRDEEAMAYVDLVGDRSRRMELLRCCGEAIAAAGDTVQGRYLIDMSHDIAETFEGAKLARSTALLAGAYTTVGDEATAQRLAQRALAIIATSPPDAYQTALVAQELTSAGCLDEARTALEAVNDPRTEPLARPHLIRALVASGRHDEALALARATPSAWRRVSQLVYVSGLLHASGAKEHAAVAARSISQLVEEQDWEWGQAPALAQAARALRLAGLLSEGDQMKERALALVARDQERKDLAASPFFTAWNTAGVVRGLAQAGDLLAAHALLEGLARGTPSADGRETHSLAMAAAWRGIAAVEAEQGNVNAAFECIEIIEQFEQVSDDGPWASTAWPTSEFPELPDDYHHSWWVRLDLIKRLAEAGFTADALSAASLLDSQSARDVARRDIVAALVDQGMLDQAREVTEAIESRADRVEALGKVAAKLAARGDIAAISWAERSIELGRMLYDPWSTSWTAFDAINGLISTGHVERASEAAAALTGADAKPWALIAIAQARLSMSEHVAAIASAEDALSAAREVTEEADPHEQVSIRVVVSAPDLQDAWVPLPTLRPDNPFKARSQLVGLARNAPNARFVGPWLMGVDSYAIALVMPSGVDVLVAAGEVERAAEAVQEVFDTAVRVQSRLGYGQWPVAQVCVELTRLGDLMRASRLVQGVGELFAASTRSAMAAARKRFRCLRRRPRTYQRHAVPVL